MEKAVQELFDRYERFFNRSLAGDMDMKETAALYASEFIAASPAGVMTGKNDDEFHKAMLAGYEHYRAIGTKGMKVRGIRLSDIDKHHCVAHVAWTAFYMRKDGSEVAIDFEVHYFVQDTDGTPKVFGWVAGDEQALLKERGII